MKSILQLVESHPFLSGLSTGDLAALAACASEISVDSDTFLFKEGGSADRSFLVLGGRVVLEIYVPSRGAVQLESIEGGGVIGWSWLTSPHHWHFDARATQPTHLLVLDGARVSDLCESDPRLGYELMKRFMNVVQHRIESLRVQFLDLYAAAPSTAVRG